MGKQKLHLHSMMVHSIVAFSPISAIAYILFQLKIDIFFFDTSTWNFLTVFAISVMLLVLVPSAVTGVFERNRVYANWHSTHKIKAGLSFVLALFLILELTIIKSHGLGDPLVSLIGLLVIIGNNLVVFSLSAYGLKITLGRQSIARTSYQPDLFKKEPLDILVLAGENKKEEAKYYDIFKEK